LNGFQICFFISQKKPLVKRLFILFGYFDCFLQIGFEVVGDFAVALDLNKRKTHVHKVFVPVAEQKCGVCQAPLGQETEAFYVVDYFFAVGVQGFSRENLLVLCHHKARVNVNFHLTVLAFQSVGHYAGSVYCNGLGDGFQRRNVKLRYYALRKIVGKQPCVRLAFRDQTKVGELNQTVGLFAEISQKLYHTYSLPQVVPLPV